MNIVWKDLRITEQLVVDVMAFLDEVDASQYATIWKLASNDMRGIRAVDGAWQPFDVRLAEHQIDRWRRQDVTVLATQALAKMVAHDRAVVEGSRRRLEALGALPRWGR